MNIRIGILGTARIAPEAIVRPASRNRSTTVTAVANRSPERARGFAKTHKIATVHESFQDLLADDDIDAVYISLPNSQHAYWTRRALDAGKHVLVEKPFARNALEAQETAAHAIQSDKVCMVGYHSRMHPMFAEIRELLPRIGTLQSVETKFHIALPDRSDIRYNYELAGGALMDLGCYELHLVRSLLGTEPEVVSATARTGKDARIDERIDAELRFGDVKVNISSSLDESEELGELSEVARAHFRGTDGELIIDGFVKPHLGNNIHIVAPGCRHDHQSTTEITSYDAQLSSFVAAIEHGRSFPTTVEDSVALARVMDDIYTAADLPLR